MRKKYTNDGVVIKVIRYLCRKCNLVGLGFSKIYVIVVKLTVLGRA